MSLPIGIDTGGTGTVLFLASSASDYVNGYMVFRGRGLRGRLDGPGVTSDRRREP